MMDQVLRISLSILRSLIIVVGAVLCIIIVSRSVNEESILEGMERYGLLLNGVYYMTLGVLILCAAAAVIFGIVFFIANIKKNIGMLIGIVAFAVIALISVYVLADSSIHPGWVTDVPATANESRLGGGGIYMVYILGVVAIGSILWTEVSRFFK